MIIASGYKKGRLHTFSYSYGLGDNPHGDEGERSCTIKLDHLEYPPSLVLLLRVSHSAAHWRSCHHGNDELWWFTEEVISISKLLQKRRFFKTVALVSNECRMKSTTAASTIT